MTEGQLRFSNIFFLPNPDFAPKNISGVFSERKSNPETKQQLFMIKAGARIYLYSKGIDSLVTLNNGVTVEKTGSTYKKLSLFRLKDPVKAYGNGKTYSSNINELIAASSKDARGIKPKG
jgi:hypothetical protein